MFKVERDGQGYRIYLGDGKHGGYKANNAEEVAVALKHYEQEDSCGMGENPNCPLCRAINAEMKAMRKGKPWVTA